MGPLSTLLLLRSTLQGDDKGRPAIAKCRPLYAGGVSRLLYFGLFYLPLTLVYIFATLENCGVAHTEYGIVARGIDGGTLNQSSSALTRTDIPPYRS